MIAIIAFFPLGIPAFYHSIKLQEEFYDGIQQGNEFNGILRFYSRCYPELHPKQDVIMEKIDNEMFSLTHAGLGQALCVY